MTIPSVDPRWVAVAVGAWLSIGTTQAVCGVETRAPASGRASPELCFASSIHDGDLVFQQGKGFVPWVLPGALKDPSGFCHVGIVVIRSGQVYVAHVEPGHSHQAGEARLDHLMDFLDPSRTLHAVLYRVVDADSALAARASRVAERIALEGRPFDWAFDRTTPDYLYCTELAWRAYLVAGRSLVRDEDLVSCPWAGIRKRVIAPISLLRSRKLVRVVSLIGQAPKPPRANSSALSVHGSGARQSFGGSP